MKLMNNLQLIGRKEILFSSDIEFLSDELSELTRSSRFLIIGGAGSIGQAVAQRSLSVTQSFCT